MRQITIITLLFLLAACIEIPEPNDLDTPPPDPEGKVQIIELSEHARILGEPTQLTHDRRASSNLAVNAPWLYDTRNANYQAADGIAFTTDIETTDEVSVWARIYAETDNTHGWLIRIDGTDQTVQADNVQEYEWHEIYRGSLQDNVHFEITPRGPRSRLDVLAITSHRSYENLDDFLDIPEPVPIPDAQYYVAVDGSDSAPGTRSEPFRTIQHAINHAQPGDTILVRQGTYGGFEIDGSGTNEAWITVQAYPGERVILDAHITETSDHAVIFIRPSSRYWIFDGFEITNTNPFLDTIRALDVEQEEDRQEYIELRDSPERRELWAVRMLHSPHRERSGHLIFQNLEVHRTGTTGYSGSADNVQFLNNHVYDLGYPRSDYGWYATGINHTFRGNIIHDLSRPIVGRAPRDPASQNLIFEQNLVYRNGLVPWYHGSSERFKTNSWAMVVRGVDSNPRDTIIRNNKFLYNGRGIEEFSENSLIAHNLFVGHVTSEAIRMRQDGGRIINNVFIDNNEDIELRGTGTIIEGNLKDPPQSYANLDGLDFTVLDNSPTINAGRDFPEVNDDFYGNPRPYAGGWDAGPVERRAD